jgi:allantoicase
MGEGWETARRRDDGNDWVELRLAGAGVPSGWSRPAR